MGAHVCSGAHGMGRECGRTSPERRARETNDATDDCLFMVAGGAGQVMGEEQVQAWQDSSRTLAHGVREVAEGQVCCHDASNQKGGFCACLDCFGPVCSPSQLSSGSVYSHHLTKQQAIVMAVHIRHSHMRLHSGLCCVSIACVAKPLPKEPVLRKNDRMRIKRLNWSRLRCRAYPEVR